MIMNFDLKYAVIDVKKKNQNHTAINSFYDGHQTLNVLFCLEFVSFFPSFVKKEILNNYFMYWHRRQCRILFNQLTQRCNTVWKKYHKF